MSTTVLPVWPWVQEENIKKSEKRPMVGGRGRGRGGEGRGEVGRCRLTLSNPR